MVLFPFSAVRTELALIFMLVTWLRACFCGSPNHALSKQEEWRKSQGQRRTFCQAIKSSPKPPSLVELGLVLHLSDRSHMATSGCKGCWERKSSAFQLHNGGGGKEEEVEDEY